MVESSDGGCGVEWSQGELSYNGLLVVVESSRVEVSFVVIVEYSCDGGVESSFDSGVEL